MSDYDKEVLTASSLLDRLDTIEANVTNTKHNFVGHTRSILDRLGIIEERLNAMDKRLDGKLHGDDVRNHRYYKLEEDYNRQLSKCAVTQANIKAIQEKLNAID